MLSAWLVRNLEVLEVLSWSPFTSLVISATGSSGENPNFGLGRSERRRRSSSLPSWGRRLWRSGPSSAGGGSVALQLRRRLGVTLQNFNLVFIKNFVGFLKEGI